MHDVIWSLKLVCEFLDQFVDGIDPMFNVISDDKLGADEDNKVTTDVKEMVEEKNVAMLRIKCYNSLSKVAAAIKTLFVNASESAAELSEIIEVGKCQYHQNLSVHKTVACTGFDVQAFFENVMSCACSHLLSKNHLLIAKRDVYARFGLSSTLQKLIIWERNLYDEVVKEEKMRFAYCKKFDETKRFIRKSAEQQKLDPVMHVPNKLSILIGMSIEVIDTISAYITFLRDERLCPKVCQLIKGLAKMWSSMYECYKALHQAIVKENCLQFFSCGDNDAQLESTKQLGLVLIEWAVNLSTWINAQKDFIKALHDWLLIDVGCAEEETPDEVAPFSPSSSRLGAPSIFVICNQWYQSIQKVSEEEVIVSMQSFSSAVLSLWKKQKAEQCQKLMAGKDMQKGLKILEKEEKEMGRVIKARSKKLMQVSGQNGIVMSGENAEECSLHVGLERLFESMEDYCAANVKVYEELNLCIEKENGIVD